LHYYQHANKRWTGYSLAGEEVGRPGGREAGHQQCQHYHDDGTGSMTAYGSPHFGIFFLGMSQA